MLFNAVCGASIDHPINKLTEVSLHDNSPILDKIIEKANSWEEIVMKKSLAVPVKVVEGANKKNTTLDHVII